MKNLEISWIFSKMADLLDILGEDAFRSRAYRLAARSVANLTEDLEELDQQGQLTQIPGVGRELARKISEFLQNGKLTSYEKLCSQVPAGLVEMMELPGLGAKSVRQIYQQLGIITLDELELAARERRIRALSGMGSKTELGILRGLEMVRGREGRIPIGLALPLGEELCSFLSSLPEVTAVCQAGSLRRGCEMVGDVDLVAAVAPEIFGSVLERFCLYPRFRQIIEKDQDRALVRSFLGIKAELVLVQPTDFCYTVWRNTGSRQHLAGLSECGPMPDINWPKPTTTAIEDYERVVYDAIGLEYIPPELRENRGEIEAARIFKLPGLIRQEDIVGDLHLHTDWSDGVCDLGQMAKAAIDRGYKYIGITEHSKFLKISRGLNEDRLWQQVEMIRQFNLENPEILVLCGIEVDILPDGELDFSDEILQQLDLVIASIHSGFRQDSEKLTLRLLSAIENPHVDIIAHPTGRMLARRDPYELDLTKVLQAAAKNGTAMEINASPDRLDLKDQHCREFIGYGGWLAINTDAHEGQRLDDIKYGVTTARRGWVVPERVINTWEREHLLRWLALPKGRQRAEGRM